MRASARSQPGFARMAPLPANELFKFGLPSDLARHDIMRRWWRRASQGYELTEADLFKLLAATSTGTLAAALPPARGKAAPAARD